MEAKFYFETSADFQRNTWRYISEDRTIHNHCSEISNPTKSKAIYYFACSRIIDTEMDRTQARKLQNIKMKLPAHSDKPQK
jgi:hypothetical protein